MILVSFVIPIYNTPLELLERGLDRIIECGNEHFETILVDDGSTNGADEICDRYKNRYHDLTVIHQDNSGVSVARNAGIMASKGKYIIFVDPDDLMNVDAFNSDIFREENADLLIFDYIRELSNGEKTVISFEKNTIVYEELIKNVLFDKNIYGDYYAGSIWAKAFRRGFLIDNHLTFNPELRKAQDRVFMLYVYDNTNSIKYLPIKAYTYYENMKSICNAYKPGAYIRSESFIKTVDSYLHQNKRIGKTLKDRVLSKVYMNGFFEMLYLDFFNLNNRESLWRRLKMAKDEYEKINVHDKLCLGSAKEFNSNVEKTKYILIKYRRLFLLNVMVRYRQYVRHNRGTE